MKFLNVAAYEKAENAEKTLFWLKLYDSVLHFKSSESFCATKDEGLPQSNEDPDTKVLENVTKQDGLKSQDDFLLSPDTMEEVPSAIDDVYWGQSDEEELVGKSAENSTNATELAEAKYGKDGVEIIEIDDSSSDEAGETAGVVKDQPAETIFLLEDHDNVAAGPANSHPDSDFEIIDSDPADSSGLSDYEKRNPSVVYDDSASQSDGEDELARFLSTVVKTDDIKKVQTSLERDIDTLRLKKSYLSLDSLILKN